MRVSLQTKIIGLVLFLLIFVISILSGVFAYIEKEEVEEQIGQLALQTASTVSFMPSVKEAFESENPSATIQPIALRVQEETGAEFVVVGNSESVRYAHPDEWKIGEKMVGGDNDRALVEGEYYISQAEGTLGPSLRGKAPVLNDDGDVIGLVSVGFLMEDIRLRVWDKLRTIGGVAFIVLILGVAGSYLLARSIRKDTLGLEPYEITAFYQNREAILSSIKEGIIAIDDMGRVTLTNQSALEMLHLTGGTVGRNIKDIFPHTKMLEVLKSGKPSTNEEMLLNDKLFIVTRTPIVAEGKVTGVVSSFKDTTEVREMVQTLSEVKRYSEGLRAQTHEHANQMYLLLGLLQLGRYDEAAAFIEEEYETTQQQQRLMVDHIKDETVQAILTGKMSRASELKVDFVLDEATELDVLPPSINRTDLVTILGNCIDNAFEALEEQEQKRVSFFATDVGDSIVFEISDNGPGIPDELVQYVFTRGFSTKAGEMRGYGLANVKEVVERLGGTMEISNEEGTVFSIFLPKGGRNDEGDDQ
ncbi:ATP-binding protein [Halobacillus salinus]|uniref:ATP-binding protein n=1 Tax=Halobacillus salinus TaxID=192814 RepID=UPI0009A85C0F|nr:sensor histidine kinase [Halobacillus salinus]